MVKIVNPVKKVRYAIDNGCITHREITEVLAGIDSRLDPKTQLVLHDEISSLARQYTFRYRLGFAGRMIQAGKDVLWKALCLVAVVLGSAVGAEFKAAKAFAGTLLEGKLTGFGDHFLYWIGRKTISISGPEMMNATYQLVTATSSIVFGMAAGAVAGWIAFAVATKLAGWTWSNWRKNRAAEQLVSKYELVLPLQSRSTDLLSQAGGPSR